MAKSSKASAAEAKPLTVRSRDMLKGPPGILGFSHLITPDDAFGQVKFKANVHYAPAAVNAILETINEAYWALVPEIQDAAKEAKKTVKILTKAEVFEWFREKMKQPNEGSSITDPHFQFDTNASYRNKDGEEVAVTIKAWDPHGAPVDLKSMRLGMGSIVKPFFTIGLWAGPLSKNVVMPKLRLVGLQVLKLKQFGGSGHAAVGEVTDADLAFLDDNFAADDLSQFVAPKEEKHRGKHIPSGEPAEEQEDEIPF